MTDATGIEGGTLSVTADIENTGDSEDSKTAELVVSDGVGVVDSQTLTLAPGEEATRVLQWDTAAGDAGSYDVTVETPDDAATRQVQLNEQVAPSVSTGAAANVSSSSADLSGDLTALGTAENAAVSIEFRESGGSSFQETNPVSR